MIKEIETMRDELKKVEKPSTFIGSAISALNAARDNLTWHAEAAASAVAQAEKAAKAAATVTPRIVNRE